MDIFETSIALGALGFILSFKKYVFSNRKNMKNFPAKEAIPRWTRQNSEHPNEESSPTV